MSNPQHDGPKVRQAASIADRFQESFDDYCDSNGIVGDLLPWAEAIFLSGYKEGYNHACADQKRIEEVLVKGAK